MRPQAVGLGFRIVTPENLCFIRVQSVAKKNDHFGLWLCHAKSLPVIAVLLLGLFVRLLWFIRPF
ncbi:hypothetical protein Pan258_19620 [Symmachiella dynata]|nr:hypothetical protein Pan258_19620 [Symmachiella dynata]